jgi:hypothetical protein
VEDSITWEIPVSSTLRFKVFYIPHPWPLYLLLDFIQKIAPANIANNGVSFVKWKAFIRTLGAIRGFPQII